MNTNKSTKNNQLSITKSNALMNTSYRLSLNEARVLVYGLSLINPIDEGFPESYDIDIKKFCTFFNIDPGERGFYKELKKAVVSQFWERDISYWSDELQKTVKERWLTRIEYSDKTQEIKVYFNPRLKKDLCEFQKNFTSYYLSNISEMKSIYGVRIYEICIMNFKKMHGLTKQKIIQFEMSIQELRKVLLLEDKYRVFKDLKKFVLEKAKKEINNHSDLKITYEVIKKGRSPYSIQFAVTKKNKHTIKKKKQQSPKAERQQILREKVSELRSFRNGMLCESDEKMRKDTELKLAQAEKELSLAK